MGISMVSALEIFTHPNDLEITVGKERGGAKFAIGIFRGPGHNFKPIITSGPFAETLEAAVAEVKNILELIEKAARQAFADPKSVVMMIMNPDGAEIDESKVLNATLINRILNELQTHQVASTYKMSLPAEPKKE